MQQHYKEEKISFFINSIIEWFKKNHRKLPFRETKDPYKIWISEVMLQQTRVGAVINKIENKYNQFLEKFPNIDSLAKAELKDILEIWSGLGYYNRAKNLHRTAQLIVKEFKGIFPKNYHDLIQLPGIGEYTACAIMSIAYNKPYAVVDGNVKRLLFRFFYKELKTFKEKDIKQLAQNLIESKNVPPSIFNQSLMEYGSIVCIYKYPKCHQCILSLKCDVKNLTNEEKLQIPPRKKKNKKEMKIFIYIIKNEYNEILIIKNSHLFLKNHYFFPYKIYDQNIDLTSNFFELKESDAIFLGNFKHNIMNYIFLSNIFLIEGNKNNFTIKYSNKIESKWISIESYKQYIYSGFGKKVINVYKKYFY